MNIEHDEYITYREASARYGFIQRYLKDSRDLFPVVGKRGQAHLIRATDVERHLLAGDHKCRRAAVFREGVLASAAFRVFDAGGTVGDAEVALGVSAEELTPHYQAWCAGEPLVLSQAAVQIMRESLREAGFVHAMSPSFGATELALAIGKLARFERRFIEAEGLFRRMTAAAGGQDDGSRS
jgi:hypothetical protein